MAQRPYTVVLTGSIASGKSTVARELERLGARRIDLDAISRLVMRPGSPCVDGLARAFGDDIVDQATGELNRGLIAQRAFSTPERSALLEKIELPYIQRELERELYSPDDDTGAGDGAGPAEDARVRVVEVPLLDGMEGQLDFADELVCVTCSPEVRLCHALGRGVAEEDFRRRLAGQPDDDYLRRACDTELANDGSLDELLDKVRAWWAARERMGWPTRAR